MINSSFFYSDGGFNVRMHAFLFVFNILVYFVIKKIITKQNFFRMPQLISPGQFKAVIQMIKVKQPVYSK